MKIGTKSVLFGAHQFLLHPLFVALAWNKLYGFPWDPRLWVAFFVHDFGYLSRSDMDGAEGEEHALLGARLMHWLFDRPRFVLRDGAWIENTRWRDFTLYHSRFYAKRHGRPVSPLCMADKLAFVLTPRWLYLPMVRATGELAEYMQRQREREAAGERQFTRSEIADAEKRWHAEVCEFIERWVAEHKDGREDTWTPKIQHADGRAA